MANDKDKNKEKEEEYVRQTGSLKERLGRVKTTRWWRFGIVALIYVLWTIWMGNPLLLLGLILLADIYLTQYLPWGAWKGMKNKPLKTVMSWLDAIVYALVLVYFLFLFIGQNYQIPSSSLEKSLLTGDFLWVNKVVYGPRVPQTPLHFPLAQNTLPFFNCKSYIDKPQLDYHRLKGLRNVERMDIVVFNFPAGDTVALKMTNPDYYTLCYERGRDVVRNNKDVFGDVIYRPVDRRDNYVKRCLGLPGETLQIKNGIVYVNGKAVPQPENVQYSYYVATDGTQISDDLFDEIGVSKDDRNHALDMYGNIIPNLYVLPLTKTMVSALKSQPWIETIERYQPDEREAMLTYPVGTDYGWTTPSRWTTTGCRATTVTTRSTRATGALCPRTTSWAHPPSSSSRLTRTMACSTAASAGTASSRCPTPTRSEFDPSCHHGQHVRSQRAMLCGRTRGRNPAG